MTEQSYHQFCPVAMASELLCTRWTMLLLRELLCGPARFNELRRGVPRMSPALLSQRLKELELAGLVERVALPGDPSANEYRLTLAGQELRPIVEAMGRWGQRWVASDLSLNKLDAQLLMWDMRRNLRVEPLPPTRQVIQFRFSDPSQRGRPWWLIVTPGGDTDLCSVDPGFDVDLFVNADLRTMTAIWMGLDTVAAARNEERLLLTGERALADTMAAWLGLSPFAGEPRMVG